MKDLSTIIENLAGFAREQNLVARAFDGCSAFLRNKSKEDNLHDDLNLSHVQMKFRSHSLNFESNVLQHPYIATRLDLYSKDQEVGWYKLIVDLDGQDENDYLVFYPEWK
jgi:hypothetical protein